jgi:hypothetical protein
MCALHAGVADAISRIAGSLQSLLQHTRLSATNITLRIELPLAPHDIDSPSSSSGGGRCEDQQVAVITVSLDKLEVSEQQVAPPQRPAGAGAKDRAAAGGPSQRAGSHPGRDARSSGGHARSQVGACGR